MKNRDSAHPGRIKLTPVDEANGIYDLTRADEPRDPGTPLNKKLLDFAVAACGVTAGTATAYTLDDEFGGFELVDGAKVNFRLHVASGANPTLNVNGTGDKPIVNVVGAPPPGGVPSNSWLTATYSADNDAYILQNGMNSRWITTTTANSYDISISLPSGFTVYHLTSDLKLRSGYSDLLYIGANASCEYFSVGVDWSSSELSRIRRINTGTSMNTGANIDEYGTVLELWIVRDGKYNRIGGLIHSARGFVSLRTKSTTADISTIHIACDTDFTAGAKIILEGIA